MMTVKEFLNKVAVVDPEVYLKVKDIPEGYDEAKAFNYLHGCIILEAASMYHAIPEELMRLAIKAKDIASDINGEVNYCRKFLEYVDSSIENLISHEDPTSAFATLLIVKNAIDAVINQGISNADELWAHEVTLLHNIRSVTE